jgi:outer membrane protein, heavy metal efflux system
MIAIAILLSVAPLRLVDLLHEARDKNPDLKAAQARLQAAKSQVSPAGALDDPMLMVQLWNAPADFSSVPVMVQISQQLPLGGKRAARREAADADAAMALSDLAGKERELDTQVAAAYFDLFLAERTEAADDELSRILAVLVRSSEARVASGKGEQVELLRAQASVVQLQSDRETALDHQRSAWARLCALLDRDPSSAIGATTQPALLPSLPPVATLQEQAKGGRPELAAAQAQISGAGAQLRLAKAASVPDVGVFAAGMHTFDSGAGPSNFLFAGFQVNLPIFGSGKNGPHVSAANAQLVAAQEAEHALRNKVAAEVAENYAHVLAEEHQIKLHHQLIPLARQSVESAEFGYAAGRVDFTMAIDSARELRTHELDLATHLAMYEQRVAELQRAAFVDLGLSQAAEAGHEERH